MSMFHRCRISRPSFPTRLSVPCLAVLGFTVLGGSNDPASAAVVTSVSTHANSPFDYSGYVPPVVKFDGSVAENTTKASSSPYGTAEAFGSAAVGTLRARLRATVSGHPTDNGAQSFAQTNSEWMDSVTADSAALPTGTPALLLAQITITGRFSISNLDSATAPVITDGCIPYCWTGGVGAHIYLLSRAVGNRSSGELLTYDFTAQHLYPNFAVERSYLISTFVGETFALENSMNLVAFASSGPMGGDPDLASDVLIDATHFAFSLASVTPGVSYFTESGHLYPVPEPEVWMLMGVGIVLLAAGKLRRRYASAS